MWWPALRVLVQGNPSDQQAFTLRTDLGLNRRGRGEGPGAAGSIAHREFTEDGQRMIVDLARTGDTGWVLTLFTDGRAPDAVVERYRPLLRDAADRGGLTLISVEPAAHAGEVHLVAEPPVGAAQDTIGVTWDLPYRELSQLWQHVGLRPDAPQPVKAAALRVVMATPAWQAAPARLREQAETFLGGPFQAVIR